MRRPLGRDDGSGRVRRLQMATYGLPSSGRPWYQLLKAELRTHGYEPTASGPAPAHVDALVRVIRYLSGTTNPGIRFTKEDGRGAENQLVAY
jgi:hypothetical protein